jgi:cytochrome P450
LIATSEVAKTIPATTPTGRPLVKSASNGAPFLDILDLHFDFGSREVSEAQERSWYAETPIGILVLRYAEARELLRDQRLNHNGKAYLERNGVVEGPIYDWFVPAIVNQDGEVHRRLRGLVSKAFTPRMIHNLRPFIRTRAEWLTERIADAAEVEFGRRPGVQPRARRDIAKRVEAAVEGSVRLRRFVAGQEEDRTGR